MCWFITIILVLSMGLCGLSAPIQARLSLADWTDYNYRDHQGQGTYAFGYDIDDPGSENVQFRDEERHANGTVTGSYGYVDPEGTVRITRYIADHNGYRASQENSFKLSLLRPVPVPRRGLPTNFFNQLELAPQSDLYEPTNYQPPDHYTQEPTRYYIKKPFY